jgi:hypothetical protein
MPSLRHTIACFLFLVPLVVAPSLAAAQSLEPRLYVPQPTGRNIVAASYGHTTGSLVFDAMMPVKDSQVTLDSGTLAYVRTFGLFGRSGQLQAVSTFVTGEASAVVAGQDTTRNLEGPADPMLRLAINLKGGPARRRAELAGVRFGTIIGASLSVSLPLGDYDHDRRINVGANRCAIKPELGVVQPLGSSWAMEGYAGVWLFGDNTDYLQSSTVTQDPLWTLQGHLIRIFGRRAWLALDGTLVNGGKTAVDGVVQNTFTNNVRLGATAGWFLGGGHALKAAFASGVYTRYGGDFDIITVGYQYAWGG